jgi:hypothetical protein
MRDLRFLDRGEEAGERRPGDGIRQKKRDGKRRNGERRCDPLRCGFGQARSKTLR